MGTFAVEDEVQKALFEQELKGQMSDGMWENTLPYDHWQPWCRATVIVDPANPGIDFYAQKRAYAFNSTSLFECVGDRMVDIAKRIKPDITVAQVRAELRRLQKLIKIDRRRS